MPACLADDGALPSQDDAHYVELSQAAAESQQLSTGASHPTPMLSLFAEDILALKDLIDFTVSDASQVSDAVLR